MRVDHAGFSDAGDGDRRRKAFAAIDGGRGVNRLADRERDPQSAFFIEGRKHGHGAFGPGVRTGRRSMFHRGLRCAFGDGGCRMVLRVCAARAQKGGE